MSPLCISLLSLYGFVFLMVYLCRYMFTCEPRTSAGYAFMWPLILIIEIVRGSIDAIKEVICD